MINIKRFFAIIILIVIAPCAMGALTEKYWNPAASGANDGSSEINAWESLFDAQAGVAAALTASAGGIRINMKGTEAAYAVSVIFSDHCTDQKPIVLRGYTDDIGDGGLAKINYTGNVTVTFSGRGQLVEGVWFEGNATTGNPIVDFDGDGVVSYRNKVTSSENSRANHVIWQDSHSYVRNTIVIQTGTAFSGSLIAHVAADVRTEYCYLQLPSSATGNGITMSSASTASYNIIQGNGTKGGVGIRGSTSGNSNQTINGNSIYNMVSGILFPSLPTGTGFGILYITNNVIHTCTVGINSTDAGSDRAQTWFFNNAIGSATSARYSASLGTSIIFDDIILTASPWTDPANGDFSLNNTAGGGALVRELAAPTAIVDPWAPTVDNYRSLGAIEYEHGGGTTIIIVED